jgi:hypothetical protein
MHVPGPAGGCLSRFVLAVVAMAATFDVPAFGQAPVTPYRSGEMLSPEESARIAREQNENWDQILEQIDKAVAGHEAEWAKAFETTRADRAAYEAKLAAYFQAHPIAGYGMNVIPFAGEDGRYERAQLEWIDKLGNAYWQADFDAQGNTSGVRQTPYGKAMQTVRSHRPADAAETPDISFARNLAGDLYVSRVTWVDTRGQTRSRLAFNEEGNPYWGVNYGADGSRSGGFYDAKLLPKTREEGPLETVPLMRIATQPCEACRAVTEKRNALARELDAIAVDLNNVATLHRAAGAHAAAQPLIYKADAKRDEPPDQPFAAHSQPPLRQRHEALMRLWRGYKKELDAVEAERAACERQCRPEAATTAAVAPNFAVGAFGGFARTPYDGHVASTALGADASGGLEDTVGFGGIDARLYLRAIRRLETMDAAAFLSNTFFQIAYLQYFGGGRQNLYARLHNAIANDTGLRIEEQMALRFLLGASFSLSPQVALSIMGGAQMNRSEIAGISRETLGGGAEDQEFRRGRTTWAPFIGLEVAYALAMSGNVGVQLYLAAGAAYLDDLHVAGRSGNFGFDYDFTADGGIRPELTFGLRLTW